MQTRKNSGGLRKEKWASRALADTRVVPLPDMVTDTGMDKMDPLVSIFNMYASLEVEELLKVCPFTLPFSLHMHGYCMVLNSRNVTQVPPCTLGDHVYSLRIVATSNFLIQMVMTKTSSQGYTSEMVSMKFLDEFRIQLDLKHSFPMWISNVMCARQNGFLETLELISKHERVIKFADTTTFCSLSVQAQPPPASTSRSCVHDKNLLVNILFISQPEGMQRISSVYNIMI